MRTHVLRPTWHFVRAEDIGWLLDLTGPRVRRVTGRQLLNAHGLDERSVERAVAAVMEALASRGQLTRAQLAGELRERGVAADGQMLMLLLDRLDAFEHDGRTFWHAPGEAPDGPQEPAGHLLQILDETYRGYQDSRWVLDAAGDVPRTRESATGMALVDGQLVASVKRTLGRGRVRFDLRPYRALTPAQTEALRQAAGRYGEYLQLKAEISLP